MNRLTLEQKKELKEQYWKLSASAREALDVAFLKIKLTVQHAKDEELVISFINKKEAELSPDGIDLLLNFFHASETPKMPTYTAQPTEVNDNQPKVATSLHSTRSFGLSEYGSAEDETLQDIVVDSLKLD